MENAKSIETREEFQDKHDKRELFKERFLQLKGVAWDVVGEDEKDKNDGWSSECLNEFLEEKKYFIYNPKIVDGWINNFDDNCRSLHYDIGNGLFAGLFLKEVFGQSIGNGTLNIVELKEEGEESEDVEEKIYVDQLEIGGLYITINFFQENKMYKKVMEKFDIDDLDKIAEILIERRAVDAQSLDWEGKNSRVASTDFYSEIFETMKCLKLMGYEIVCCSVEDERRCRIYEKMGLQVKFKTDSNEIYLFGNIAEILRKHEKRFKK